MSQVTKLLEQAWQFRHACKVFDPNKKVSDADFHTILESARMSPSSFGLEPWEFVVVQNRGIQQKIGEVSWGLQRQLPGLSHLVVILARRSEQMQAEAPYIQNTIMHDTQHLSADIAAQRTAMYKKFRDQDFCLDADPRVGFEWAARQCYIALGNMMTTAAMLNVDSCAIEGFNQAALETLLVQENIMDQRVFGVACMVAFGYRAKEPHPKTRRQEKDVVRWIK